MKKIRIYYEDTDAGGVVYHTNYLKYCERARSEYFFSNNLSPIVDGGHFVVRKLDCDFIAPALFADIIEVKTSLIELKNSSFTVFHEIIKDDKVIFSTTVVLVLVKDNKVKRLTMQIKEMIQTLFKTTPLV